jgi:hypothetical protein
MPLRKVTGGDLIRTIVGGLVFLLVFLKLVPEDATETLTDLLNQAGNLGYSLVIVVGAIIALFKNAKTPKSPAK